MYDPNISYCRRSFEAIQRRMVCCKKEMSEIEMMESVGVTMRGGDSLDQQLQELDPQSRILSGLSPKVVQT